MQQWEYLVVYLTSSDMAQGKTGFDEYLDADLYTEKLNVYGKAGWELVNFSWGENGAKAAFKRAK